MGKTELAVSGWPSPSLGNKDPLCNNRRGKLRLARPRPGVLLKLTTTSHRNLPVGNSVLRASPQHRDGKFGQVGGRIALGAASVEFDSRGFAQLSPPSILEIGRPANVPQEAQPFHVSPLNVARSQLEIARALRSALTMQPGLDRFGAAFAVPTGKPSRR